MAKYVYEFTEGGFEPEPGTPGQDRARTGVAASPRGAATGVPGATAQ